jgi:hypothetical protein
VAFINGAASCLSNEGNTHFNSAYSDWSLAGALGRGDATDHWTTACARVASAAWGGTDRRAFLGDRQEGDRPARASRRWGRVCTDVEVAKRAARSAGRQRAGGALERAD